MTDNLDILLLEFYTKLAESQEDLDPEFAQILEDNFWELIDGEDVSES